MKRLSQTFFDKSLTTFQQTNKRGFSLINVFRKDAQSSGTSTPPSPPGPDKGSGSNYMAAASQNYTKSGTVSTKINTVLTPTLKQSTEQPSGTSQTSQARQGDSSSIFSSPTSHPPQDARREVSSSVGTPEKLNVHILKTNLDQLSNIPQGK